jgi:hypothetical protein
MEDNICKRTSGCSISAAELQNSPACMFRPAAVGARAVHHVDQQHQKHQAVEVP